MKLATYSLFLLITVLQAGSLTFESTFKELHANVDAKSVAVDFKFSNQGTEDVTILTADGGCTCMKVEVADGKFTYKPGESGILRSIFEVGSFQGAVEKGIHIRLKGDPVEKPSHILQLRIHVPVIISLTPKTLKWDLGEKPEPKSIRVDMNYKNPVHITSIGSSNENFTTELVVLEKGRRYDVKVTPKKTDSQGITIIRIMTDVDVERHRLQQGFATIRAPLPQ